ncbi:cell division protein FtsZ [Croceiramulus getboli]|nr:cell division protein FtsZ [Flavobacteriaceae bacterium YJPT1-3]
MSNEFENISFDMPKNQSNVIKVIGVGGGGSNAINHMFQQGIKGVDFVICNTDAQALENSAVPIKIQLGVSLTEGLGAGANPEVGERAALESVEEIKRMLDTNTKMIFITAGMGGGTGTGAAPVIAKMAREMDILTVGIVTIPFQFEGKMRNEQAQLGVEKLRAHVDSLVVINNNKLREVYGNLGFKAGFSKADEVLSTASRGIAEVITHHYTQNIDLRDAKTVLSNSGTAIMGSATSTGGHRASEAIRKALDSPLLNDNKITGAKNVLLLIVSGREEITIDEIGEINDHIQDEAGHGANIIMGVGEDESLGEAISVTVIATGFNAEQQNEIVNTETKKIIHTLEEEQRAEQELTPQGNGANLNFEPSATPKVKPEPPKEKLIVHTLDLEEEEVNLPKKTNDNELIATSEALRALSCTYEDVSEQVRPQPNKQVFEITDVTPEPPMEGEEESADQFTLTFDMPLNAELEEEQASQPASRPVAKAESQEKPKETEFKIHRLDEEVAEIEVNEAVEIIPVTEVSESGEKRYSLDDYMEVEDQLMNAKAETDEEETLVFEKKTVEVAPEEDAEIDENDPMNAPIAKLLVERAAERKRVLKEFNYKFHNHNAHIEEIEKQPAYKRMGIDLDAPKTEGNLSRTTLGSDGNDDIQLRTNNSFLHDNVD